MNSWRRVGVSNKVVGHLELNPDLSESVTATKHQAFFVVKEQVITLLTYFPKAVLARVTTAESVNIPEL